MVDLPNQIVIVGQIGSGKSLLASRLLRDCPRVLVIDPSHDFEAGLVVTDWAECMDALDAHRGSDRFRLVYRPSSFPDLGGSGSDVVWLVNKAYSMGEMTVFIDELSFYTHPAQWKGDTKQIGQIFALCRHSSLRMIFASQRPSEVHKQVYSQADRLLLRVEEPRFIRDCRQFYPNADDLMSLEMPLYRGKRIPRGESVNPDWIRLDFRVWPLDSEPVFSKYRGPM